MRQKWARMKLNTCDDQIVLGGFWHLYQQAQEVDENIVDQFEEQICVGESSAFRFLKTAVTSRMTDEIFLNDDVFSFSH